MVTTHEFMALELHLPWELDEQRERAFKKILKRMGVPLLVLFLLVPWLPEFDMKVELETDDVTRTQVLLDPIAQPEPEPVIPQPEPQPEPEPVAPSARPAPTPSPQSVPKPEVNPRQSLAESQGLAELSNQLSAVRGSVNVASLKHKNLSNNSGGDVARTERARLGEALTSRSSGMDIDETVMTSEITELSAHQAADVAGLELSDRPAGRPQSYAAGQSGQRDMESIRRTLEQAKGTVYALYQRALQDDPALTGEFTFKLVIEPNGSISELTLLVSELGMADLERNILKRIEQVNFGAMEVPPTIVEYRFVFLPS